MRLLASVSLALFLSACAGAITSDPLAFDPPLDCNNLSKHGHPDFFDACGNEL